MIRPNRNDRAAANALYKSGEHRSQFLLQLSAQAGGTQIRVTSSDSRIIDPDQEIPMRSKLAISALVVASLFGATVIASAQTEPVQPAPGAKSEGKTGSKMAPDRMKSSNMKRGTTTGAAPEGMTPGSKDESKPGGQSTARKPTGN
jgi:hypothetical protein